MTIFCYYFNTLPRIKSWTNNNQFHGLYIHNTHIQDYEVEIKKCRCNKILMIPWPMTALELKQDSKEHSMLSRTEFWELFLIKSASGNVIFLSFYVCIIYLCWMTYDIFIMTRDIELSLWLYRRHYCRILYVTIQSTFKSWICFYAYYEYLEYNFNSTFFHCSFALVYFIYTLE